MAVTRVELINLEQTVEEETQMMGHTFDVAIEVTDRENCTLRWFERTNIPYVEGMPVNAWCNMYAQFGAQSNVFAPWINSEDEEGGVEVFITDVPAMSYATTDRRERILEFHVVVVDTDTEEVRGFTAIQTLVAENNQPNWGESDFHIVLNNSDQVAETPF